MCVRSVFVSVCDRKCVRAFVYGICLGTSSCGTDISASRTESFLRKIHVFPEDEISKLCGVSLYMRNPSAKTYFSVQEAEMSVPQLLVC